jgi:hypothetical protein
MKPLPALLALAMLVALGLAAYAALGWAAGALAWLGPQLAAPVALAVGAALAATWLAARAVGRAGERRTAELLRAERAATYQLFADVWAAVAEGAELAAERRTLDRLMALYAGPGALQAHLTLRALERGRGPADPALRTQLARALVAIRRDLGLETRGVSAEDLAALFAPAAPAAPGAAAAPQSARPRVSLVPGP